MATATSAATQLETIKVIIVLLGVAAFMVMTHWRIVLRLLLAVLVALIGGGVLLLFLLFHSQHAIG